MAVPHDLPTCPHCHAIRSPGAPMCLTCWQPFEDEPRPETAAEPVEPQPVPVAPSRVATYESPFATSVSSPLAPSKPVRNLAPMLIAAAAALLLLVVGGGYLVYRAVSPNQKSLIAERFRAGRPPSFIPAFPDLPTVSSGVEDTPGAAQAYVATWDPTVRTANDHMMALQGLFSSWAAGKTSDDQLRTGINGFLGDLHPLDGYAAAQAPDSVSRAAGKLTQAATDYEIALGSLLDWLDSRSASARTTYSLEVASANVHWDEGLIAFYRGSGLTQPKLPHPQPQR